jgi:hypothetical protein
MTRPWSVESIYRLGIWLPLIVPAGLAIAIHGLGLFVGASPASKVAQLLLASLLYGGVPYFTLAVWATWWISGRSEVDIRHLMFRAPFVFALIFMLAAAVVGRLVGQPVPFIAVGVLGSIASIVLGYFYVFCVVLMREELGP